MLGLEHAMLSWPIPARSLPVYYEPHPSASRALRQQRVCADIVGCQPKRAMGFTRHGCAVNRRPGSVLLRENTKNKDLQFASSSVLVLRGVWTYPHTYEWKWRHQVEGSRESDIVLSHCCVIWIICLNFPTDQCQRAGYEIILSCKNPLETTQILWGSGVRLNTFLSEKLQQQQNWSM